LKTANIVPIVAIAAVTALVFSIAFAADFNSSGTSLAIELRKTGGIAGFNDQLVVQVSLQDAETLEFIIKNTDFTYVLKSPLDVNAPDPSTTGVDLNSFKAAYGYR